MAKNLSECQIRAYFRYHLFNNEFMVGIKNSIDLNTMKFQKISCKKYPCARYFFFFEEKGSRNSFYTG